MPMAASPSSAGVTLPARGAIRVPRGEGRPMDNLIVRSWRELAGDWKVWVWIVVCLAVATISSVLGYD